MKEFENHSAEVLDIISTPPSWLLKWGVTVFIFIMCLLFALSRMIKYPVTVKSDVYLLSGKTLVKTLQQNNNSVKTQSLKIDSNGYYISCEMSQSEISKLQKSMKIVVQLDVSRFRQADNIQTVIGEIMPLKYGKSTVTIISNKITSLKNYQKQNYLHGNGEFIITNKSLYNRLIELVKIPYRQ